MPVAARKVDGARHVFGASGLHDEVGVSARIHIPDLPCGLVLLGLQPGHDGAVNKLAQGAGELLVGFQVGAAEHPLRRVLA